MRLRKQSIPMLCMLAEHGAGSLPVLNTVPVRCVLIYVQLVLASFLERGLRNRHDADG